MHSISAVSRITKPITPAITSTMEGIPSEGPDRGQERKTQHKDYKQRTWQESKINVWSNNKENGRVEKRHEGKAKKFVFVCEHFKNGFATEYLHVIYVKCIYKVDKIGNSSTNHSLAPWDRRAKVSSTMFATTWEVPLCKPSFNSAILATIIHFKGYQTSYLHCTPTPQLVPVPGPTTAGLPQWKDCWSLSLSLSLPILLTLFLCSVSISLINLQKPQTICSISVSFVQLNFILFLGSPSSTTNQAADVCLTYHTARS